MTDANGVRMSALRPARTAAKLSQRALAAAAGLDQALISRLEAGLPGGRDVAEALADALGTTVAALSGNGAGTGDPDADPGIVLLAWTQLRRSPLNPRKTFETEALRELADSIAEKGLFQNLVVRPYAPAQRDIHDALHDAIGGPERYEIVAGERRERAIGLLCEEARWDPTAANIPARVIRADDAEALETAILENLQRRDVNPMEEAEAFARLRGEDPRRYSATAIAGRIGKSVRYVEQRLAISGRLTEKLRDAVRDGEVGMTQARILAGVPAKTQNLMLDRIRSKAWDVSTTDQLKRTTFASMIPVERAYFDLAAYTGDFVTDEDSGQRYFADPKAYDKLQKAALAAKLEALGAEWAWAEKVDWFSQWAYREKRSQDRKKAGAVLVVDRYSGAVTVEIGLVKKPQTPMPTPVDWEKRRQAIHAFAAALGAKLLDEPETALRLVAYGALSQEPSPVSFYHNDDDLALGALCAGLETPPDGEEGLWNAIRAASIERVCKVIAVKAASGVKNHWHGIPFPLPELAERLGVPLPVIDGEGDADPA